MPKFELGFIWLSKAWYGKAALANADYVDEVRVDVLNEGGLATNGVAFKFYALGTNGITPWLEVAHDMWDRIAAHGPLLEWMSEEAEACRKTYRNLPPDLFVRALIELGYRDVTPAIREGAPAVISVTCQACGRQQEVDEGSVVFCCGAGRVTR